MKTKWLAIALIFFAVIIFILKTGITITPDIIPEPTPEPVIAALPEPAPEPPGIPDILQLVNIHDLDSTILVDLKYATTDNFTGTVLYTDLDAAYLQPDVAQMLAEANRYLKTLHPGLRLLVYDAVRPLSVQQALWECVKDTKYHRYVAHPDRTGLHNYGAAVDLTLADTLQQPMDMGTPFDFFGRAAGTSDEQEMMEQGLLNGQHLRNRQLLRQVMRHAGFRSISGEWWHFNACSLHEAKQRYTLIEHF